MSNDPAKSPPITGLVAAVFTPFDPSGNVDYERIPELVDFLHKEGLTGIYICGSTGEAPSLTSAERLQTAEAYVTAAAGRLRTIVQIGHSSVRECQTFGEHAERIGADAISAIAPYYFPVEGVASLVDFLKEAAASAPSLPFYYYHIPAITGPIVDPVRLLSLAGESMPSFRGIKFTDSDLSVLSACLALEHGRFDCLFGRDEMLLGALAMGAKGAVGSTYNFAPALYQRLIEAFQRGDHAESQRRQSLSVSMIEAAIEVGGQAALKSVMNLVGQPCGPRRLPMKSLPAAEEKALEDKLTALGFQDWACREAIISAP